MSDISGMIQKHTNVTAGQVVGKVGNTGWSKGSHLHLGIKKNNEWQNPEKVLGIMADSRG